MIEGREVVTVVPITHAPPRDAADAVEIPTLLKRHLGLDDDRSWIVVTETNDFVWPGPDLRPMKSGDAASIVYGELPADLFRKARDKWLSSSAVRRGVVTRTE
jgi:hypothetical protein